MASKKPTVTQIKAIYNAGFIAYHESYAMMIEDILEGMKPAAARADRRPLYDIPWFQEMAAWIRSHKRWDSIPSHRRDEIIYAVKEADSEADFKAGICPWQIKQQKRSQAKRLADIAARKAALRARIAEKAALAAG